ncbi:MAG: hypothetical protein R3C18_18630 [Planctomycetaceae bacterium]
MVWYLFPVAAAVSLVWNATRYESTAVIIRKAIRLYVQTLLFMAVILGVLMFFSWRL